MDISVELTLTPLQDDYETPIIAFIKKYKARYGEVPDSLATLGYDAARIMIAALQASKSLDHGDIRDAIAATSNYPGVSGNITINADRNAVKPLVASIRDRQQRRWLSTSSGSGVYLGSRSSSATRLRMTSSSSTGI